MTVHPTPANLVRQMLPKIRPRHGKARGRYTGPTRAVLDIVRARAGGRCERCACPLIGGDPHHRKPRGMGGSRDPRINTASNIVALCRPCHDWIESQRVTAQGHGWLVPRAWDPRAMPVRSRLHGLVLLADDGTVTPIEGGAA